MKANENESITNCNVQTTKLPYRPELLTENKCSTPNNLRSISNFNTNVNKQNDMRLDESQVVITSLKASISNTIDESNLPSKRILNKKVNFNLIASFK